jgi:hypothetical protein
LPKGDDGGWHAVWQQRCEPLVENSNTRAVEHFPETNVEPKLKLRLLDVKVVRLLDEDRAVARKSRRAPLAMQEESEGRSELAFGGPQKKRLRHRLRGRNGGGRGDRSAPPPRTPSSRRIGARLLQSFIGLRDLTHPPDVGSQGRLTEEPKGGCCAGGRPSS